MLALCIAQALHEPPAPVPQTKFKDRCPDCKENTRTISSGGNINPYCAECARKHSKARYLKKGRGK